MRTRKLGRGTLSKFVKEARANPYVGERWSAVGFAVLLNLTFLALTKNLGAVLFVDFLFFLAPYFSWRAILWASARKFLRTFLLNRIHARYIPRVLQKRFLPDKYFLAASRLPRTLWWRTTQLLFFVFFLSSLTVPRLPFLLPPTAPNEIAEFGLLGILNLAVFGPILALVWVYEDWGLRGYDPVREVVYPIGSTVFGYIAGFGAIGSVARFIFSLNVNQIQGTAAVLFWLFLLLPPCLWTTVLFHIRAERKIIRKLKGSDVGQDIFIKSIRIE